MSALDARDFGAYFSALWGHEPFPWQSALARRLAEEESWPEVLALPTGAGKTACIDIAVFALACQAQRPPGSRTAPRRVFFAVDRRIIVDEAHRRASQLAQSLSTATGGILSQVADALRRIAGGDLPLAAFQLRGGMYRDDAWARSPIQPTVISSTVDQLGSRLLFRGYGLRSGGMRPIHAGLVANDSLIVLDEAHCVRPFLQSLQAVARFRTWRTDADAPAPPPMRLVVASATAPDGMADLFGPGDADRAHPVLGPRMAAAKPVDLVEENSARGPRALERLAATLAKRARELQSPERLAIGIIVNRVETARRVHAALDHRDPAEALLLTGRMRPIDRDDATRQLMEGLRTGATGRPQQPVFVVATQTLEVGADLDLDALVTECAPLDALRQRFGRLNRAGRPIDARGCIVVRGDQTREESDPDKADPIYGNALPRTWQWLQARAAEGPLDMGVDGFAGLLARSSREEAASLQAPAPDAPVMLPAHLDAWCQTWPVPAPDPEVALFLHGPGRTDTDVQVCWRADLLPAGDAVPDMEQGIEALSHCPPSVLEAIPVPIGVLRSWLAGVDRPADIADVEGAAALPPEEGGAPGVARRRVLRWRGPEDSQWLGAENAALLRPGDTVVVPAELGGWNVFGHRPPLAPVDRGDEAHLKARGIPVIRISPDLLDWGWPDCPPREQLKELCAREELLAEDRAELMDLLDALAREEGSRAWLTEALRAGSGRFELIHHPQHRWLALRGTRSAPEAESSAPMQAGSSFTDEDESSSATVRVGLAPHLEGVGQKAEEFAREAGLPEPLVEDLRLAGRLHDLGKADPRFQALLHGGNPWMAQASGQVLAKSGMLPQGRQERDAARRRSGYPRGGRHELLSVRMAEESGLLAAAHDADLVLHLVASHHGRCRPFAPVVVDDDPLEPRFEFAGETFSARSATGLERLDSGVPDRFWRLVRRYGWWGLAWLEAILRLADHRRSEAEQRFVRDSAPLQ